MTTPESARLLRIRDQLKAIAPGEWARAHDKEGCFVEARCPRGELLQVARFHPGASEAEIDFTVDAPRNVAFLLDLVDRAIKAHRKGIPQDAMRASDAHTGGHDEARNYAAQCAMTCGEPAFRVFLETCHGLERPLTDERVAQKVRSILGVTSRRKLNEPGAAADRWKSLRSAFDAWKRAG